MTDIFYSAVLGLVAGLLPVYLGLLPLPFFRRLSPPRRTLLVSFSVGILLFLFADVTGEAVELSGHTWYGALLFAVGLLLGVGVPFVISSKRQRANDRPSDLTGGARILTAYIISLAIGLHNLGEGLAIGAAYAGGQFALTTVLVVGFALHNGTEGMAIAGPVSEIHFRIRDPLVMGFVAGFPTVLGSILGATFYSELTSGLFFSLAAGALLYVVIELTKRAQTPKSTFVGIVLGILLMYFTDLLLTI
jgi:ZIP family zinc transporter